ncbi:MAG TPA: YSC84-related protein [bacterium]|nr:YSC84-related protein [bacterium]
MWTARSRRRIVWTVCLVLVGSLTLPSTSQAATAQAIDASANKAIAQFKSQVKGADAFLRGANGYLMFPEVIQAGIGIGGEYGEGVLRVGGKSAAYYSIAAGSIGFQLGAQRKSILIVFLQSQALKDFRAKAVAGKAWNVGVDGSVALLNLGAQASINSATINKPIVGFVFQQSGLMYNLSLEGAKISKLQR